MIKKNYLEAIATLVGTVIGAGIFAIPYVVAKAGFIAGAIEIILIGGVVMLMNLYMGEICLRTKGFHQLTGYAEKYLGQWGKRFMTFSMIFGIYGALIAYMIGEGQALYAIFSIGNPVIWSLVFFAVMALLIYIGLRAIEESEFYAVPIMIIIAALIILFAISRVNLANLTTFSLSQVFLPYGVILFAFLGTAAIPEMREELVRNEKSMKKAVMIGMLIPMAVYLIFTFVVVGITGVGTTEVATIGLGETIGSYMILFGNLFVVFAMATCFLALGLALKGMYDYDYKMSENKSWALSVFIPLLLFFVLRNFVGFKDVINITGAIAGGLTGILVVLMVWKARRMGDRKPEYSIMKSKLLKIILIIVFGLGILYQFWFYFVSI